MGRTQLSGKQIGDGTITTVDIAGSTAGYVLTSGPTGGTIWEAPIDALPLVGGTMAGNLDMNTYQVIIKSPNGSRFALSVDDDGVGGFTPL
jgi:hypothetical protein